MSLATQMIVSERYGPILRLPQIAEVLGLKPDSARNVIARGECPFPVSKQGIHTVAHYRDVAEYIDTLYVGKTPAATDSFLQSLPD